MLVQQAVDAGAEIKYGCEGLELLYHESGTNGPDGVDVYGLKYKDTATGDIREAKADIVVESSGLIHFAPIIACIYRSCR